jgi:hypothetical protein
MAVGMKKEEEILKYNMNKTQYTAHSQQCLLNVDITPVSYSEKPVFEYRPGHKKI